MMIESEDIKQWLKPYLKKYTINFSTGKYIMDNGVPYYLMYKFIKECENKQKEE